MIDIENFPTNKIAQKMMKTVSPIYDKSYVAKWLYQVMGIEMEQAWQFFEELRLQAFPETATWGIVYWEQRYHIASDDSLPLEERRRRVIAKRGRRGPMNPAKMEQIVQDVTGRSAEVIEQNEAYVFYISIFPGESNVDYKELVKAVMTAKQSHLSFVVLFKGNASFHIRTSGRRFSFEYPLCGTFHTSDDERWSGRLLRLWVGVKPQVYYGMVSYPLCGTFYAGGELA